ncbi:MAG: hypothetical protein HC850_14860 [Rhodomicrobium sp.]|nr:hypothetical protein [Rhodomicrobium sp.]
MAHKLDLAERRDASEKYSFSRQIVIDEFFFVIGGYFAGKTRAIENLLQGRAFGAGKLDRRHGRRPRHNNKACALYRTLTRLSVKIMLKQSMRGKA